MTTFSGANVSRVFSNVISLGNCISAVFAAGNSELHTHHLADREPLRPSRAAIDELLLNFILSVLHLTGDMEHHRFGFVWSCC